MTVIFGLSLAALLAFFGVVFFAVGVKADQRGNAIAGLVAQALSLVVAFLTGWYA